jgi:hypothetical protein
MGSYPDFVFGHDPKNKISIGLTIKKKSLVLLPGYSTPEDIEDKEIEGIKLHSTFGYMPGKGEIYLDKTTLKSIPPTITLDISRTTKGIYYAELKIDKDFTRLAIEPRKFHGGLLLPFKGNVTESDIMSRTRFMIVANQLSELIVSEFNNIYYLGPLRDWPKRYYVASGETPVDVGQKGEKAIDVLFRDKREKTVILDTLQEWLTKMELGKSVDFETIKGVLLSFTLKNPKLNQDDSIADVGFGISQVIPVIVESLLASKGSLVLIEQPEIHLHPKPQATVIDVLISQVKLGKTFIIETHSEHMVARLQRRIAEGGISNNDVAIYYLSLSNKGTKIRKISLDEYGLLGHRGLPQSFFAQEFNDRSKQLDAIYKRKMNNG